MNCLDTVLCIVSITTRPGYALQSLSVPDWNTNTDQASRGLNPATMQAHLFAT